MSDTTRFTNGVNNVAEEDILGEYLSFDPSQTNEYFNDFDTYSASNWFIETVGSPTQLLTDGDNGVLEITTSAGNLDTSYNYKLGESFKVEPGKKLFFKCRYKASDLDNCLTIAGLTAKTTPLDAFNAGIVFFTTSTVVQFSSKNGFLSDATLNSVVNDTYVDLGFYYDGKDKIYIFQDGDLVKTISPGPALPNEETSILFGISNLGIGSKTMSVDYIFAAKER